VVTLALDPPDPPQETSTIGLRADGFT